MFQSIKNTGSAFGSFRRSRFGRFAEESFHRTTGTDTCRSAAFKKEVAGLKGGAKFAKYAKSFGWIGAGIGGLSMLHGYKEGGVAGAAKEFGMMWAGDMVIRTAMTATGLPILATAGAMAGAYAFGKAAGSYGKKMTHLELAAPHIDQFGTVATIRQRSLQALQDTHLNGRGLLGNEAAMMHQVLR